MAGLFECWADESLTEVFKGESSEFAGFTCYSHSQRNPMNPLEWQEAFVATEIGLTANW